MKKILLLFACILVLSADTSSDLDKKEKLEKTLTKELGEISKTLQKEEALLNNANNNIEALNKAISQQQIVVNSISRDLKSLAKTNEELLKEQVEIEKKLIDAIAKDLSFFLVSDSGYVESSEGIMANEALKYLGEAANKEIALYSQRYEESKEKIKNSSGRLKSIQRSINDLETKKENLEKLKNVKVKLVSNVKKEQNEYLARIKTIQQEKKELKKTLENLKIVQQEENAKLASAAITIPENFESAKRLGSSYQASKVKTYKGSKTIPPLSRFTVLQKFGDYVDPVYNIKIFNESVVLRSAVTDDEVKNILDGKIVFAKETSLLKNVVIIENTNGIHTIYAHLSKIAPTIQVGSKVKKGYVIGRVDKDLTFEVTQQNYHINPLELIAMSK